MAPSTMTTILGGLIILHAAYSYRHYIKLVYSIELENVGGIPPLDVIIEIILGSGLILFGLIMSLQLKPIRISSDIPAKPYQEVINNVDFMIFNHRGIEIAKRNQK